MYFRRNTKTSIWLKKKKKKKKTGVVKAILYELKTMISIGIV